MALNVSLAGESARLSALVSGRTSGPSSNVRPAYWSLLTSEMRSPSMAMVGKLGLSRRGARGFFGDGGQAATTGERTLRETLRTRAEQEVDERRTGDDGEGMPREGEDKG
jgi:hypothetical protein